MPPDRPLDPVPEVQGVTSEDLLNALVALIPRSRQAVAEPFLRAFRVHLGLPEAPLSSQKAGPGRPKRPPSGGPTDRTWVITDPGGQVLSATLGEASTIFNVTEGSLRALTSGVRTFEKRMADERWGLHRDLMAQAPTQAQLDLLADYARTPPWTGQRA